MLQEIRNQEANKILNHYLNENKQYHFTVSDDLPWNISGSEFALEIPKQLIRHKERDLKGTFFFYVDFYEDTIKAKSVECFSKKGTKLNEISSEFYVIQHERSAEFEKISLQDTLPDSKKLNSEFPDNFKF